MSEQIFLNASEYYQAVKKEKSFATLRNGDSISAFALKNPQFQYGDVSYSDFSKQFKDEAWLGRKVIAIPAALWASVKVLYHMCRLVFDLVKAIFTQDTSHLKTYCFRTVRDMEEAFGRIVSLFHDKFGSYHVQQAAFHQQCYDCFGGDLATIADPEDPPPPVDNMITEHGVQYLSSAIGVSLLTFKEASPEERAELIQKYGLQQCIHDWEIEQKQDLDAMLNGIDSTLLDAMAISDLILPSEFSRLRFAVLSDQEFAELNLKGLNTVTRSQYGFMLKRMKQNPIVQDPNRRLSMAICQNPNLADMHLFTPGLVDSYWHDLPDLALGFLTNDQIRGVEVKVAWRNLEYMFTYYAHEHSHSDVAERFRLVHLPSLIGCIQASNSQGRFLPYVPEDIVKQLDISRLNREQFDDLFPATDDPVELQRQKDLFATFGPDMVKGAVKKGQIGGHLVQLLSDAHWKKLSLDSRTDDPKRVLEGLFPEVCDDEAEQKRRFALIAPGHVESWLNDKSYGEWYGVALPKYLQDYITDDQLQKMKMTRQQVAQMLSKAAYRRR